MKTDTSQTHSPCKLAPNSKSKQEVSVESKRVSKTGYIHIEADTQNISIIGSDCKQNIFIRRLGIEDRDFVIEPSSSTSSNRGVFEADVYYSNNLISDPDNIQSKARYLGSLTAYLNISKVP